MRSKKFKKVIAEETFVNIDSTELSNAFFSALFFFELL